MPPIDATRVAEAQVTVAVVLAGFAFAGFVFLLTRPKAEMTAPQLERRFSALLFLIGAFSVGTFSAFLYATSIGTDPWPAYRSLVIAHAGFVLLATVTVAAVMRLLALEHRSKEIMGYAWIMASVMMTFFQFRFAVELARAESNLDGGSDLVAGVMVVTSLAGMALAWALGGLDRVPGRLKAAIPYTSTLALVAIVTGIVHITSSFSSTTGSLPTWLSVLLMTMTTLFSAWSVLAARPDGLNLTSAPRELSTVPPAMHEERQQAVP